MSNPDKILGLLQTLKESHPDVKACMVAKKGLEGLILFPEDFKQQIADIWDPLSRNIDDMLSLAEKYSCLNQSRMYSEIFSFGSLYLPLPMTDTALIVFLKGDNPFKSAEIILEMAENTRKGILES